MPGQTLSGFCGPKKEPKRYREAKPKPKKK